MFNSISREYIRLLKTMTSILDLPRTPPDCISFLREKGLLAQGVTCCDRQCSSEPDKCSDGEIFICRTCKRRYRGESFFFLTLN